jgi:hypothetical protein
MLPFVAAAAMATGLIVRARAKQAEDAHPPLGRFVEADGVRLHYGLRRGDTVAITEWSSRKAGRTLVIPSMLLCSHRAIRIRGHSAGRLSGPFAAPWRTRHDSIV